GRTRDRGSVKGLDRTTTFTTVLLTSGESRAVGFSEDGGTRARVLTLWGLPFGKADQETARLVHDANVGMLQHYGHAGPRLVRYLLEHRDQWPAWRGWYRKLRTKYLARAGGSSVVGRLADAFAALTVAGILAAKALGIRLLARSPVRELWPVLTSEAADADRA